MAYKHACIRALSAMLIVAFGLSFAPAPAAADTTGAPSTIASSTDASSADVAQASNPFADVPANHWAYDAVRQLAADGYIQGYPDGQFKGQRPMTRYEMAVLTDRAVRSIEAKLAQLQQVEQRDIAAVRALMAAFGPELAALKAQMAALQAHQADQDKQLADLKKEADATQLRVNQGKVGLRFMARPGTTFINTSELTGPTGRFAAGATGLTTPFQAVPAGIGGTTSSYGTAATFGSGNTNAVPIGPFQHGTFYQLSNLYLAGQIDPRWSYGFRLKEQYYLNPIENGNTLKPAFCTAFPTTGGVLNGAPNCSFQDLGGGGQSTQQGNVTMALDFGYVQYNSPGGLFAQAGRFTLGEGRYQINPESLLWGGQSENGLLVGMNDPNGRYTATAAYFYSPVSAQLLATAQGTGTGVCSQGIVGYNTGAVQPVLTGVNPNCNTTGAEYGGHFDYYFPSTKTDISITADSYQAQTFTYWDPSAALCGNGATGTSAAVCAANGVGPTAAQAATNATPGAYIVGSGNLAAGALELAQYFGNGALPQFQFGIGWGRRLGSDPFTGVTWAAANTYSASLTFASKGNLFATGAVPLIPNTGKANSNVVELSYQYIGLNSIFPLWGGWGGSAPPESNTGAAGAVGAVNGSGMQSYRVVLDHWVSDNVRFGITALHIQNIPGVFIPAGNLATCPGCAVNSYQENQIYLDSYFYFL
jgi:hypothetical protein